MSIHQAVVEATEEVLGAYLAPNLASQLTQEITAKIQAGVAAAVKEFLGFDLATSATRSKASGRDTVATGKVNRGRRKHAEDSDVENSEGALGAGSQEALQPALE